MYIILSQYPDMDAENQNFLPEYNLGKKKYETEYVSTAKLQQIWNW